MKYKQKVDIVIAAFLILLGTILLILPMFNYSNVKVITIIIFTSYTLLNAIQFILTRSSKDYEGLYSAIASGVILIASIILNAGDSPRILAMLLMSWIILMSLTKLKKIDYYHDRRDRMWKFRTFNLSLFILSGILASINLAYVGIVQIIVLGFFMLIHGILELFDPIVKTIISHG